MEQRSRILTVEEMASVLRISRVKAYQLVHQQDFPALRIGRVIRVSEDALYTWISQQSRMDI